MPAKQARDAAMMRSDTETEPLVFVTGEIENIPPGWRARDVRTGVAGLVVGML